MGDFLINSKQDFDGGDNQTVGLSDSCVKLQLLYKAVTHMTKSENLEFEWRNICIRYIPYACVPILIVTVHSFSFSITTEEIVDKFLYIIFSRICIIFYI